jgi:phosphatidylglycerophosphatase A
VLILGVLIALAVSVADYAERILQVTDPSSIVCDEMVGFWLTTFLLPSGIVWFLLAFGLFRWFDITKPWPIQWMEKTYKGGLGIVLDDLAAALYSWLALHAIYYGYQWVVH